MHIGKETKEFHEWLRSKFNWIDNDVKRLMFKAWCGRAKLDKYKIGVNKNENS